MLSEKEPSRKSKYVVHKVMTPLLLNYCDFDGLSMIVHWKNITFSVDPSSHHEHDGHNSR